jgi:hypothetical protein
MKSGFGQRFPPLGVEGALCAAHQAVEPDALQVRRSLVGSLELLDDPVDVAPLGDRPGRLQHRRAHALAVVRSCCSPASRWKKNSRAVGDGPRLDGAGVVHGRLGDAALARRRRGGRLQRPRVGQLPLGQVGQHGAVRLLQPRQREAVRLVEVLERRPRAVAAVRRTGQRHRLAVAALRMMRSSPTSKSSASGPSARITRSAP